MIERRNNGVENLIGKPVWSWEYSRHVVKPTPYFPLLRKFWSPLVRDRISEVKNWTILLRSAIPHPLSIIDTSSTEWFVSIKEMERTTSGFSDSERMQAVTELSINSLHVWRSAPSGVPNPVNMMKFFPAWETGGGGGGANRKIKKFKLKF
jgi:hypothetical protein